MQDPFHAGERAIQERVGERDLALLNGRLIASSIPAGARTFPEKQQYCAFGWAAPNGDLWATLLTGRAGFAVSDAAGSIVAFALEDAAEQLRDHPPFNAMRKGDNVGMLFIELATRRRLRINGAVAELAAARMTVNVREAYPNCPKYIQRRESSPSAALLSRVKTRSGSALTEETRQWIRSADTFFVASGQPTGLVDCSHRGGKPGFTKLVNGDLRIPDYPGNSLYQTFGNLLLNPHAGLVFIDFEDNRQLQLTGETRLELEAGEIDGETGGSGRWWVFSPRNWVISPLNVPLAWTAGDQSPFNP